MYLQPSRQGPLLVVVVVVVVVVVLVVVDVVVVAGVRGSTNSPVSSSSKPSFFKALPILETFLSSRRTS